MQRPSSGLDDSEDPETLASCIFYIEIVAGFVVAVPPAPGDPLRADDMRHRMHHSLVREGNRRTLGVVRRRTHHAKLQGSWEKTKRTGRKVIANCKLKIAKVKLRESRDICL